MVSNDQALRDVTLGADGVLAGLSRWGVHVVMSTVSPQTARELAALHREKGVHYVAAPVLGRPEAAAARKLWIVTAGPAEGEARAMPAFHAMGQGVLDYGEDAAAANVVKLAEDIGRTVLPAPPIVNDGRVIAAQEYEPAGFRQELGHGHLDWAAIALQLKPGKVL